MKKFTCLLVAFLAISSVYTTCPGAANNFMETVVTSYGQTAPVLANGGATGVASGTICGTGLLCCDAAKTSAAVTLETNKAKTQYQTFGEKVGRFGAMMAKITTLVNASTAQTTLGAATGTELNGGVTAAQLQTFAQYTPVQYNTDFEAFKAQVVGCYDYHALAIQKSACWGCIDDAAKAQATTGTGAWATAVFQLSQASCNEWVTKCNKVWNFMHKAGWFIHAVALLNKKKEATSGAVTFSPPANVYPTGHAAIADINTALTNCGTGDVTLTTPAACDQTMKTNLCKSFISLWSGQAATTIAVGRSDTTFIVDAYNPTSTVARRVLAVMTGALEVPATGGVDVQASNTAVFPPTAAIASFTTTAMSSGYTAPAASSSSSASSSTATTSSSSAATNKSSAKVVISTILSAIFAIALLN